MPSLYPPAAELQAIINAVVDGLPTARQVSRLAKICQAIAVVYLRRHVSAFALEQRLHVGSHDDLAYDCIADLFRSDADGSLPHLKRYFAVRGYRTASNEALLSALHRLVFSSTHQGLVRVYAEADSTLSRLIRGIKNSVRVSGKFVLRERFGEQYLLPLLCSPNEHLPVLDREQLEDRLSASGVCGGTIPKLMRHLALLLKEDAEHCRMIPLLTAALAFRSIYAQDQSGPDETSETDFILSDGLSIIRRSCREVHNEMFRRYVEQKAISPGLYDCYGQVMEDSVVARLTGEDGSQDSLFQRLADRMPGLTRDEYCGLHRSRLEYLSRLAEDLSRERLKKSF